MIWEQYAEEFERQQEIREGFLELPEFSRDAVIRARFHLANRGGVLLADDVGLGKTYQAGELISRAVNDDRSRVLVVAPAVLRDGSWNKFIRSHNLPVQVVSYDELAQDKRLNPLSGSKNVLWHEPNDYAMVVIDEAHNLRNPSTQRASAVRALLGGNPPKDVVFLTATPINNSLWDLYHLLKYFVRSDAAFADVSVPDLRNYFAAAMEIDPEDLTAAALSTVLDQVSVRRTRPFIKRYYPNATIRVDGKDVPVTFPTPKIKQARYDFAMMLRFIDTLETALDGYTFEWGKPPPEGVLAMARYQPSMYRKEREDVDPAEINMAGLLRSMLLKRFESSPRAFANTCATMARSHEGLVAMVEDHGKVATGQVLAEWLATDGDDEEIEAWLDRNEPGYDEADNYDVKNLCKDLERDQQLLMEFANIAGSVSQDDDPKLADLVEQLVTIAEEAALQGKDDQDVRNKRKVLLFSYYADTVDWIFDFLKQVTDPDSPSHDPRLLVFRGRIASVSGQRDKADVLLASAPKRPMRPKGKTTCTTSWFRPTY